MTRDRLIASAAAAAALAAAAVPARADTVKKLRFERVSPAGSALAKGLDAVAAEVKAKTKGALIIEWVQRPATDSGSDVLYKMHDGRLDGAELDTEGLASTFPLSQLLALPYADTEARAEYVADHFWSQLVPEKTAGSFVLSSLRAATPQHLFASERSIPLDEKGRTVCRLPVSDATAALLELQMSRDLVAVTPGEVAGKLAGKASFLCYGTYATAEHLRWVAKAYAAKPIGYALEAVVIQKQVFDGLPAAQQKILLDALNQTAPLRDAVQKEDAAALKTLREGRPHADDAIDWHEVLVTRGPPFDSPEDKVKAVTALATEAAQKVK